MARHFQAHQLDQLLLYSPAFSRRPVKLEVAVEHSLAMGEAAQIRRNDTFGIETLDDFLGLGRQPMIFFQADSTHNNYSNISSKKFLMD